MSISDQGNTGGCEGGICGRREGPEEVLRKLNRGVTAFGPDVLLLDFMMVQATRSHVSGSDIEVYA